MMELVMFVGIPASGKSTYTERYRQLGYQILSSDEIRGGMMRGTDLEVLSEKDKNRTNSQVFETVRRKAAEALKKGCSVVVDATNLSRKRRMSFLEHFRRFACRKVCILFVTPVEICLKRNRKRMGNARVPENAMYRMLCNFECPNYWEGWDEIIPVISPTPYAFPFEKIRGLSQDNPHHTLTLDAHLEAAVRYCAEQNCGEMLERVARYHDIGKLYTKQYCNSRGVATADAHYMGHENYGAYLYLTEMCCGKQLSAEEFRQVLYETNLINCHMRPLLQWSWIDGAEEKDVELFGKAFVSDLKALNRADRAAH